jgi:hypothetical protein
MRASAFAPVYLTGDRYFNSMAFADRTSIGALPTAIPSISIQILQPGNSLGSPQREGSSPEWAETR